MDTISTVLMAYILCQQICMCGSKKDKPDIFLLGNQDIGSKTHWAEISIYINFIFNKQPEKQDFAKNIQTRK